LCYAIMAAVKKAPIHYRKLGNSGLYVSELCFGMMTMDKSQFGIPYAEEKVAYELMDRFAAAGGNFFDKADVYGLGQSERVLGTWLARQAAAHRGREAYVIATKARIRTDMHDVNAAGSSRKHLMAALERSLANLQTPYVDLFQLHAWDPVTPLHETLHTLNDLVRSGRVRYVGVSNFTGWQLQKFQDTAKHLGLEHAIALQPQYSLLQRGIETELVPVCENEGLGVLPWSPLCGGWLSGRYQRGQVAPLPGSRVYSSEQSGWAPTAWSTHNNEPTWQLLDVLKTIAHETNQSMARVSLRWLLQKPAVVAPVFGVRTMEQLEDNLGATSFVLSDDQMQRLNTASQPRLGYPYDSAFLQHRDPPFLPVAFNVVPVVHSKQH